MTTALDGHIAIDAAGVARIAGTRMKVAHLVMDKMAHNSTPEQMQEQFPNLSLAQIYAALTYYWDHQAEVDAQIEHAGDLADKMRSQAGRQPSLDALKSRVTETEKPKRSGY